MADSGMWYSSCSLGPLWFQKDETCKKAIDTIYAKTK